MLGEGTEELAAVVAGQVRDRTEHALAPEQLVREGRDRAHVDAGADDGAALADRRQRLGDELAGGREDDRGVELLRPLADGAGPRGAELARQRLRRLVAGPGEGEDAASFVAGELRDDVRRGAEAVEPEALAVAGGAERAVADQPRAEERRQLRVARPSGSGKQ